MQNARLRIATACLQLIGVAALVPIHATKEEGTVIMTLIVLVALSVVATTARQIFHQLEVIGLLQLTVVLVSREWMATVLSVLAFVLF